jgi:hypothetical protein
MSDFLAYIHGDAPAYRLDNILLGSEEPVYLMRRYLPWLKEADSGVSLEGALFWPGTDEGLCGDYRGEEIVAGFLRYTDGDVAEVTLPLSPFGVVFAYMARLLEREKHHTKFLHRIFPREMVQRISEGHVDEIADMIKVARVDDQTAEQLRDLFEAVKTPDGTKH